MSELKGQMSLFTVDGCDPETTNAHADEVCRGCDECTPGVLIEHCTGDTCWCVEGRDHDDA